MKRKSLNKLISEAKQNVLHLIIGSNLAIIGVTLLTHHRYFFWPPHPAWITAIENDSVVGFIGLCVGLGMIGWAMDEKHSNSLNRFLISTASAYYALLSATEFMHGLFAPAGVPNMLTSGFTELALLFITLYMAKISPGKDDDDY
ncbi:Putative uncharacterized protein ORF140 [Lactobacillus equicursoris DSM 19284 = JCM 14600 = CIP 110162]|uniref:hypothetical protein n=1 Tax=Lactobacillus equicursoris TaxID=420645 RepID=UPI000283F879|nr:hypothetical protein [Lactobacillus equicursoris]CCK85414.1 Putative uncharacterized protein ORF140 [Lactobacillus equicursoris DSM 19284 = JCM 14600 = CIP 110162]